MNYTLALPHAQAELLPLLHNNIGVLKVKEGQWQDAVKHLRKAMAFNQTLRRDILNLRETCLAIAEIYRQCGMPDNACIFFRCAREMTDPDSLEEFARVSLLWVRSLLDLEDYSAVIKTII
jgi:uncharacterized protein HemY